MIKSILAVIGGYALWTVVFLGGSAAVRSAMSSVHDADGITTDVPALVLYLLVSMLASVGAGYVAAVISKANVRRDAMILAVALLATTRGEMSSTLRAGGACRIMCAATGWGGLAL